MLDGLVKFDKCMYNHIKEHAPFGLTVATTLPASVGFNIKLFGKKDREYKLGRMFIAGSNVELAFVPSEKEDAVEMYLCSDDDYIDRYTIPNDVTEHSIRIDIDNKGGNLVARGNSTTGYIVTDIIRALLIHRKFLTNINLNIGKFNVIEFKSLDSLKYHYHNLALDAVCKVKKIIEPAYVLNSNIKLVRILQDNECIEFKRTDSLLEYTIGETKYIVIKRNNGKKWYIIDKKIKLNAIQFILSDGKNDILYKVPMTMVIN